MTSRLRSLLIAFLATASICGCSHFDELAQHGAVGPNYVAPSAVVASNWLEQNNPYLISFQNGVPDEQWWRIFGDEHLNRLVDSANCNYLPLEQASLQILERQHQQAIAKGNLFPQTQTADGAYQRIQFSENGNQIGIAGLGSSFDLFQIGRNASWEIDLWGRLRKQVESAQAKVDVSREDWRDLRLSLNADVVEAYVQIRLLQQRIHIAKQQYAAQLETLRIAEKRAEIGTESRLDVTQALATARATQATIAPLQAALRQNNNRLCILIGRPPKLLFDEFNAYPIPVPKASVCTGIPRDLIRRRPDIRSAEREIAAQNALIGVATADLFPQFILTGRLDLQAFELSDLFDAGSLGGAIAPGFSWKILNYGRIKNNIKLQQNRFQQAVVNYRQTVLDANREAEDAMVQFTKKREELQALRLAVEATRESVDLATIQYQQGAVDLDRVNNLRKDLISQLDRMTKVEGETTIALVSLYRSIGGGWQPPPFRPPEAVPFAMPAPLAEPFPARPAPTAAPTAAPTKAPTLPASPLPSPLPMRVAPMHSVSQTMPGAPRAGSSRSPSLSMQPVPKQLQPANFAGTSLSDQATATRNTATRNTATQNAAAQPRNSAPMMLQSRPAPAIRPSPQGWPTFAHQHFHDATPRSKEGLLSGNPERRNVIERITRRLQQRAGNQPVLATGPIPQLQQSDAKHTDPNLQLGQLTQRSSSRAAPIFTTRPPAIPTTELAPKKHDSYLDMALELNASPKKYGDLNAQRTLEPGLRNQPSTVQAATPPTALPKIARDLFSKLAR